MNNYFNLAEDPFSVTSDARFFFNSEGHEEALAHLVFGLKQRKGFMALTGEVGAGKTTLLNALLDQLDANWKHAFLYNSKVSFLELLRFVLYDLGVEDPPEQKVECIRALNSFLLQSSDAGHEVVIIIDEAQNLSEDTLEEIRLLSNLETYSRKLLQIVFAGQPEFGGVLNSPKLQQLNQRVAIRYHLGALKPAETEEYIQHRLRVAGAADASIFQPAALRLIHGATRGIPRLINQVCSVALLQAALASKRRVSEEMVRHVLETEFSSHGEVAGGLRAPAAASAGWLSWKGVAAVLGLALAGLSVVLVLRWDRAPDPAPIASGPVDSRPAVVGDEPGLVAEDQPIQAAVPVPESAPAPQARVEAPPAVPEEQLVRAQSSHPATGSKLATDWKTETVLVGPGESISYILQRRYGQASWDMVQVVMQLNPSLTNPDIIQRGTLLSIPLFTTTKAAETLP
ncbi:MAG: AAA family ATPase [Candidatus Delongbacteria bacterium]